MEEIKEKQVCVNIQNYTGEKPVEVIIRKGEAAKAVEQLPTKAPIPTELDGVITAPYDWLEKRIELVDQKKAHVIVDREQMTIRLIVNEDNVYQRGVIKGSVEFTEIFKKTKINSNDVWVPERLGQFLRINRVLFSDKEKGMKLVSKLKGFKAEVKSKIEKMSDPSGSRAEVYRQNVESNLSEDFVLNLSIFRGTPKVAITVEFDHYLVDGDCVLQLVSPGASEAVESYRDNCIDDVLRKIRSIAPDIAIIEV